MIIKSSHCSFLTHCTRHHFYDKEGFWENPTASGTPLLWVPNDPHNNSLLDQLFAGQCQQVGRHYRSPHITLE